MTNLEQRIESLEEMIKEIHSLVKSHFAPMENPEIKWIVEQFAKGNPQPWDDHNRRKKGEK